MHKPLFFPTMLTLIAVLVMTCIVHPSPANALRSIPASSIRNQIPAGKIISSPTNLHSQRAQAFAAGRTKIPPPSKSDLGSPLYPANDCWHCLPGRSECYDMCENAGDRYGRWSGCPRCNTCYNPDVPEDVARCTEDRCRDRGAFNGCIGGLSAAAAAQCLTLVQPSAVLACAGTRLGLGAMKVVPCFMAHCVPW
ncbi:hypothetical protein BCR44DRAFT_46491 [Catenaria anguillulae PL171]|uniref:TNFR-Cys domain-containing protein n=1 Tax=Catenaria anguillulae PL171 TaxID=765915 RepID=A0A1Y2I2W9_9FUNG|nr:hypothetical protein BCR44DRAFT_46493 [Catenaria anguillulae PL171]ORZ40564.1 hypothetical protein BCR44DRAFT_46491 [Catenaria anguillulae PL171]